MSQFNFVVITENDVSQWSDETGILYHFPKRYLKFLKSGTRVVYYKGRLTDKKYKSLRLSNEPHYFGFAEVESCYPDQRSKKGDHFALLTNFTPFSEAVLANHNGDYIESIPKNRKFNYWRDGVREIDEETYDQINRLADFTNIQTSSNHLDNKDKLNDRSVSLESGAEGSQTRRYVTIYERDRRLRAAAIAIHGFDCVVCGFNFEDAYGEFAKGYIQVHHIVPVSERDPNELVNPETDLCLYAQIVMQLFIENDMKLNQFKT